jgi:hypothetical protein
LRDICIGFSGLRSSLTGWVTLKFDISCEKESSLSLGRFGTILCFPVFWVLRGGESTDWGTFALRRPGFEKDDWSASLLYSESLRCCGCFCGEFKRPERNFGITKVINIRIKYH